MTTGLSAPARHTMTSSTSTSTSARGAPPPGVVHVEGAFSDEFLARLDAAREAAPVSLTSGMMRANRRFIRDDALAEALAEAMPRCCDVDAVCSDLRFIEYDEAGGYISAHVDGERGCPRTGRRTNVSFLLYLSDVPEDEGGETDFLERVTDENSVVFSVRPTRGAVVVFPHDQPHVGRCVGEYPKIVLRGDAMRRASR